MKSARFGEPLSLQEQLVLVLLLALIPTFLFPFQVKSQVSVEPNLAENRVLEPLVQYPINQVLEPMAQYSASKTSLIFDIKTFPTITIPEIPTQLPNFVLNTNTEEMKVIPEEQMLEVEPDIQVLPNGRVYMHEPQIRAYMCPKLEGNCETFIAILKAENGTHECTRDNRGLNRNGSIDVGLAQINWNKKSPYTMEQLQDCKFNLDIAYKKYQSRGFKPWVAYTKGSYKKYLRVN